MKGKWKVSYNPTVEQYIVVRLRDVNSIDHSGNREYGSEYMSLKEEAQALADKLNSECANNG